MAHIHTKAGQHDATVSAFIVVEDKAEPTLLLHRHKKLGTILPFGGHIELDEHPWRAMLRELEEESGYTAGQLRVLQPVWRIDRLTDAIAHPIPVTYNTHPVGPDHFHSDATFALITDQQPALVPGTDESADIQLLTSSQIQELSVDQINQNVREICFFIFHAALPHWQPVPATDFEG